MIQSNSAFQDKFAQYLEIETLSVSSESAKVRLAIKPQFCNGANFVHGGIIFTLADYAFALAANNGNDSGLGINASINFIKAVLPTDTLFAEAKLVSRTRKLGTYQITVTNIDSKTIAIIQSTAYFK